MIVGAVAAVRIITAQLVEGGLVARMGVGIEVRGLNAWYGKNLALKDIDMSVQANHVTAVIGPSGCGKSTFVRCLNRMHETIPDARAEGSVKVGDMDVYGSGTDPVEVRRSIGMVFQKPNPFPTMSIYDNVRRVCGSMVSVNASRWMNWWNAR